MRRRWQTPLREPAGGSRVLILGTPLLLLAAFSLAVKSADSSGDFRIDQRQVLQELKHRIGESSKQPAGARAAGETASVRLRELREVVRKGDTFRSILRRLGVRDTEVSRWASTTRSHASLSRLQTGHRFTFLVPTGTDRLAGLQYELSPDSTLVMREEGDEITARIERLPRMTDVRVVAGTIESSLYASATERGVPEAVVSTIADIFGWDIDFTTEIRPGDRFRVAYEEQRSANAAGPEWRVLAADLDVLGRHWKAVYFQADDDGGNYYSPDGRPYGRAFLRYPVEFTRVSSRFASSRFHPVLGVSRPHLGVDFAAPIGTSIRAIAAGRVEYAGWHGGSGRYVKIDHGAGLESSYAHLSSIARDVRAGTRVQIGQVIGTVGASGLATGPHLHFALFRGGVYVNPMTVKLPASPSLAARYMEEFVRIRDGLLQQLAAAVTETGPTRLAVAAPASRMN